MKVYAIKVEPTERGERYTLPCGNCGHSAVVDRLLLERPGRTDVIDKPPVVMAAPVLRGPVATESIASSPPPRLAPAPARRQAPPKPRAKPEGKARRRR